jgi:hypothetical protein
MAKTIIFPTADLSASQDSSPINVPEGTRSLNIDIAVPASSDAVG